MIPGYPEPKVERDRNWRRTLLFRYHVWVGGRKFTYGPKAPRVRSFFGATCRHNWPRIPVARIK